MSKPKQGLGGKSSKASLKSRGLSTLRPGSLDGCYSLYSTDSEDNVSGVNRGLDKCAELLTNILEIKSERKGMRKSTYTSKQHMQQPAQKNKKAKSAARPKSALTKIKPKATVYIPTGGSRNAEKSKTAYNEKVVASTPVLTTKHRKHLQELQKKEHALKEQIQLLQEEYDNLETNSTKQPFETHDNSSERQEAKPLRRSLDFSNSAEKPFVDNPQTERSSSSNVEQLQGTKDELVKARKVQFAAKAPELQTTESNIVERTLIAEDGVDITRGSLVSPGDTHMKATGSIRMSPVVEDEIGGFQKGRPKPESPQRYSDHLRILAYLVGELQAFLASSGDNEVDRLLAEIESEVRLLTSYTVHSPKSSSGRKEPRPISPRRKSITKQHDIDTEIAMQPLRSENSDLRRKLRIANQRTRDLEEQLQKASESRKEYSGEEGVVEQLHKQLLLERENVSHLRKQNEKAEKVIAQRNIDYSNLQELIAEKDEEFVNLQDELKRHRSKAKTDVDYHYKHQLESMEMTIRGKNKEVELLKLAVDQRDAEIERLTELTRGLQESLTRVLKNVQGLHPEDILSEVSMLSGIEPWKPMKVKPPIAMPSAVSTAATRVFTQARGYADQPPSMVHSDEEFDIRGDNREYPRISSPVQGRHDYRRTSIDSVKDDETTISVSSADEFVFKQELANLDTVIARLQDSLRNKCAETSR